MTVLEVDATIVGGLTALGLFLLAGALVLALVLLVAYLVATLR